MNSADKYYNLNRSPRYMTGLRSQTEAGTENANVFPYEKRLFTLIPKIQRSAV